MEQKEIEELSARNLAGEIINSQEG
jgi:hypothetical protein